MKLSAPNHRRKLTAHLANFLSSASLTWALGRHMVGFKRPKEGVVNLTDMCRIMCRLVWEGENADESSY